MTKKNISMSNTNIIPANLEKEKLLNKISSNKIASILNKK